MTALMREALTLIQSGADETVRRNPTTILSDQDYLWARERKLKTKFRAAVQAVCDVAEELVTERSVVADFMPNLLNALDDNAPSEADWDERIRLRENNT